MPNQPQDPLTGSTNQYGPFTSAITGPLTAQNEAPPISSAPSRGGAIALYLGKFLQGAQVAKRQQYEKSEAAKREGEGAMFRYAQAKMADPNLSPEGKQALTTALNTALAQQAQETLKDSDKRNKGKDPHPLLALTKQITNAVLGPGENPKHKDFGSLTAQLMTIGEDPKYKIDPNAISADSISSKPQAGQSQQQPQPGVPPQQAPQQQPQSQQQPPQPTAAQGYLANKYPTQQAGQQAPPQPTPPPPGTTPAAAQAGVSTYATKAEMWNDPSVRATIQDLTKKGIDWTKTLIGQQYAALPDAKEVAPKGITAVIYGKDGTIEKYVNAVRTPNGDLTDPATGKSIPGAVEATAGLASNIRAVNPSTTLQKVWVKRPGAESPEYAFVDPKNPQGYIDVNHKTIDGATPVAAPAEGSGMARVFGDMARSQLAKEGVKSPTQDQIKTRSGDIAVEYYGSAVARRQQEMAIDQEVSGGIGPGRGLTPQSSGSSRTPPPGVPTTGDKPLGSATTGSRNPPPITASKSDSEREQGSTIPKAEEDVANRYMDSVTGINKGGGKAAQVAVNRGRDILVKRTGLNPTDLQTAIVDYKASQKALSDAVGTSNAYLRVQKALDAHGDVLENAAKELKNNTYALGDNPLKNATVQWFDSAVGPHPELQKYREAMQAVSNEYARLISGGVQSRAQLPVSAGSKGEALMPPNMTMADVQAAVSQLKTEAAATQKGFSEQQSEIKSRLANNPISKAFSPSNPKGSITVIVTGPDGKETKHDGYSKEEADQLKSTAPAGYTVKVQ